MTQCLGSRQEGALQDETPSGVMRVIHSEVVVFGVTVTSEVAEKWLFSSVDTQWESTRQHI